MLQKAAGRKQGRKRWSLVKFPWICNRVSHLKMVPQKQESLSEGQSNFPVPEPIQRGYDGSRHAFLVTVVVSAYVWYVQKIRTTPNVELDTKHGFPDFKVVSRAWRWAMYPEWHNQHKTSIPWKQMTGRRHWKWEGKVHLQSTMKWCKALWIMQS